MTDSRQHRTLWILAFAAVALIAILIAGLALLTPVAPANPTAVSAANALVETGHTAQAIGIYEQLIAAGARDSTLFYNLGNAYYRQGDLVAAVANYQRAAELAPRDPDIRANLELALGESPALAPLEASGPQTVLADITATWLSLDEVAVIVLVLWFGALLLFLAGRLGQRPMPWLGRIAAILLFATLVLGLSLAVRALESGALPGGLALDGLALWAQFS